MATAAGLNRQMTALHQILQQALHPSLGHSNRARKRCYGGKSVPRLSIEMFVERYSEPGCARRQFRIGCDSF
ncbi:hypothetical protein EHO51_15740 [Methylocystis rosea]|uniref:Uncharacterized protein n=1 Tax=Methylocystis rosea TaxID=173366 RepID=A0A3G8M846_9HYPH|nr:hypothetical protein [Methylocystis rosea]AZG78071.1 hypothetical protein EHO51_15740 [Methylocystis rosea]